MNEGADVQETVLEESMGQVEAVAEVAVIAESSLAGDAPAPSITLFIEEASEAKALLAAAVAAEAAEQGVEAQAETAPEMIVEQAVEAPVPQSEAAAEASALPPVAEVETAAEGNVLPAETAEPATAEQVEMALEINTLPAALAVGEAREEAIPVYAAPDVASFAAEPIVAHSVEPAIATPAVEVVEDTASAELSSTQQVEEMAEVQEPAAAPATAESVEQAAADTSEPAIELATPQVEVAAEGNALAPAVAASDVVEQASAQVEIAPEMETLPPATQAEAAPELNALAPAAPEAAAAEAVIVDAGVRAVELAAPQGEVALEEIAGGAETMVAESVEPAIELAEPHAVEAVENAASVDEESSFADEVAQILPRRAARPAPVRSTFLGFYGLKEQPFGVTPDPAYLYLSEMHRAALRALSCGIENDRGFIALIAPPGMGKTTLLNKLMEDLRDTARVVFLFQTQCDSREFFSYLLRELGEEVEGMDIVAMHARLNALLFQEMLEGRRFVLIVDEAQNLDDAVLETIRLLSDFETAHAKLLEIVLVGQPELAAKLARPGLAQLRQRIGLLASLAPLSAEETGRYVEHRLGVAGYSGEPLFTEDALQLIAEHSQGTPRRVNNICFNGLMAGYLEERRTINAEIVRKVVGGLELESLVPRGAAQVEPAAAQAVQAVPEQAQPQVRAQLLPQPSNGTARGAKVRPSMLGKISEVVPSGHVGKEREFRLQATLERDASGMPFANRYYCCSFYMGEAEAMAFRVGQRVRVTVEHE